MSCLRVWLLSSLALVSSSMLSACKTQVDADRPLPYRCDPASPAKDAQCAGGWRCASDGFCRDPAQGVASPCETSADCLGGWHCGAAKVCYDRAAAGAIVCRPERDADGGSDCADPWRCPSTGICQLRGAAGPYACASRLDCEANWHCGVLGRSYDRTTAQGVPCREELDFNPLERDCADGWACAANGRCVDARTFELRPNGAVSALRVEQTSGPTAAPTHVSSACLMAGQTPCTLPTLTVARGAQLEQRTVGSDAVLRVTMNEPVTALVSAAAPSASPQVYSLVATATGVSHVDWHAAPAPSTTPVALPFSPERLSSAVASPWFFASRGGALALVAKDNSSVVLAGGPAGLDGGALALERLTAVGLASERWLLGLTAEGLFGSRVRPDGQFMLTDGGAQVSPEWVPLRVPGAASAACAADGGRVLAVSEGTSGSTGSGTFRELLVVVDQAGVETLHPSFFRLDVTPAACLAGIPLSATCPVCPSGERLVALHGRTRLALCEAPDGGAGEVSASCGATAPFSSRLLGAPLSAVEAADPSDFVWAGTNGMVMVRGAGHGLTLPLRLARPPDFFALTDAGQPVALSGTLRYSPTDAGWTLRDVASGSGGPQPCAAVRGAERFWVMSSGFGAVVSNGALGASLADGEGVCSQHQALAEAFVLPDGGTAVIAAARDRVWSEAPFPPASTMAWPVRTAPAPFATITSLASLRPGVDPAAFGAAFVLANSQVFSLRAEAVNRWTSRVLNAPPGEPFRVWADPQRGRVTYRDGTTFTLPLMVRVSGPLPEPMPQVKGLREMCGAGFALGAEGVYRLEAGGAWQKVPGTLPGWTQLFSVGETLFAVDASGSVFELTDAACLRP